MTETRGGFGEHSRHSERGGQAGHAEGHSRRPHEYAGSARQEHNEPVIEDVRARLHREQKTTILPDGTEVTHFPTDPEALAQHKAWLDSLSPKELKVYQKEVRREWDRDILRGGLSLPEYLARHPEVDPDLWTEDGRYLPALPFGDLRYDLKKLGKFISWVLDAVLHPDDEEKKQSPPQLIVMHSEPEKESREKPQAPDKHP